VFKTIAWATDGSSTAGDALSVATRLAQDNAAKIVIVHVDELPIGRAVIAPKPNGAASAAQHRTAQELHAQGIEATVMSSSIASGDVAQGIVNLARKAGADVIIAGNRRRGPLARLLLGDVASRLLQIAPCPVLVVPSRRKADTPRGSTGTTAVSQTGSPT
jgi:nucleotide-binding universal stress UspA family protein